MTGALLFKSPRLLLLLIGVIAVAALPLAGLFEPLMMRNGYLSLVLFHGWLEIAIIAHFLLTRHDAPTSP